MKVFVGWDSREPEAFHVFAHSIIRRATRPIELVPLVQRQLREIGVYARPVDVRAATEFSLTRFLVPYLSGYRGWSVFADCDMLMQVDIWDVLHDRSDDSACVWACQHDYVPKDTIKMDGQAQTAYPRKNWSSFMLFNNAMCEYRLKPAYVNEASPADLHRFTWAEDRVGSLPLEWNWLVGEYAPNAQAKNLHYTNGGPWFDNHQDCDHADLWLAERDAMLNQRQAV